MLITINLHQTLPVDRWPRRWPLRGTELWACQRCRHRGSSRTWRCSDRKMIAGQDCGRNPLLTVLDRPRNKDSGRMEVQCCGRSWDQCLRLELVLGFWAKQHSHTNNLKIINLHLPVEVTTLVAPIAVVFKGAHRQIWRTSRAGLVREVSTIISSVTHSHLVSAHS